MLPESEVEALATHVADPQRNQLTVDLPAQTITLKSDGRAIGFEIDALRKDALMRGLDAVGATLEDVDFFRSFEKDHYAANPWLRDANPTGE